ncbi:7-cyano-7-deazaguanine reductase [Saccharicrinis fermentans]|uniref:NADPH-dependent 7-cyano-7-deazaguanine reductase n=1 Tax=Saccharicrinis fermentans DSM 9555 = JCM 21142 TaxID=869213 RepID=W7YJC9_9BACT|nr:7-cyano-7-deazaguanine reductase [Saccharicrinis fermentans]GAF04601.1 NADPH-dependent 7-cyano-7-deazaguanine reductase [Saccharicrinis fermentans DSM 9555 = JCM 21142]
MNPIEGKVLGKQMSHPRNYAPEILVAVPRSLNREQYGMNACELPFVGVDAWHAYELGFLTEKGLPVVGVLKLVYACDNESLVESKSLKLYLNSFNMGRYGENREAGIAQVLKTIRRDLSELLKTTVEVSFHNAHNSGIYDFDGFGLLEEMPEADSALFEKFKEDERLLEAVPTQQSCELKVSTHLLRSNCKITHQPDWGSAFIHLKTKYEIDRISLLRYLVSIRDENHFHEEICEMLYKRLVDKFDPEILMVACLYTRRGGIDICPVRANKKEYLPRNIIQSKIFTSPAFRQ